MASYWAFDDNTSKDIAGNNDGRIYGAAVATGKVNNALSFDGDDYVDCGNDTSLDIKGTYSVVMWINRTANNFDGLFMKGDKPYGGIQASIAGRHFADELAVSTSDRGVMGYCNVSIGSGWSHIAIVYTGSIYGDVKIYKNGIDCTMPGSAIHIMGGTAGPFIIGRADTVRMDYSNGSIVRNSDYFKGVMDEVAVYNKALIAGEIQQLYQDGLGNKSIYTAGDGIGDACSGDSDKDGILDGADNLIGDSSWINAANFNSNVKVFIDGSDNLSKVFEGTKFVEIKNGNEPVGEFKFNFSLGKLLLEGIKIEKQNTSSPTSYIILKNISLQQGKTKTAYVDRHASLGDYLCVKDTELSSIREVSSRCDGSAEQYLYCGANNIWGINNYPYNCTIAFNGAKYKVDGLKHSGLKEFKPTTADLIKKFFKKKVCIPSWSCTEWAQCTGKEKAQVRTCVDANKCGSSKGKPAVSNKCANYRR